MPPWLKTDPAREMSAAAVDQPCDPSAKALAKAETLVKAGETDQEGSVAMTEARVRPAPELGPRVGSGPQRDLSAQTPMN